MILANGPVSVLISGSCGAFPSNSGSNFSYLRWTSVSHKPLFDGALSLRLMQKRWNLGAGSTGCRIRCTLADKEVGSGSVASRFLEEEFKFSPAFDDYVKVLESVRTDRSKGSRRDEGDFDSKKRSVGKEKSIGIKKHLRGNKDDREERANARNNSRGERIDNSWRNKELKGKVGVRKHKSNGGWGLVEGHLEKGTAGRIVGMGKSNLENNSNHSYSRALRTSNSQGKVSNAGENVNNGRLVKGNVSYLRRSKDMQQEKSKVTEVDRLEIFRRNNGKMDRSKSSILGRRFSDENSKIAHGKVGVRKNKSNGGWGLVEGHLEKGTAGRIVGMGKSNLENNSNHSYSRALRTSNSQGKVSNAGENVNNSRLVKGNVSYLRRSKHMQQEKSKVTEVDRLEISRRNNGKMDQSKSSILGRRFSDENSKIAHGEPIVPKGTWSSNNNLSGDLSDHDVHYISDKNSYRSKVGKKIYDSRTKILAERLPTVGGNIQSKSREPEIIKDEQKPKIIYGNNMSNKGFGSNIGKNTVEGKGDRMMDHGDTGTSLRRNRREFELEDDCGGQNKHVNNLIGKPNNRIEHAVRQNNVSSLKISDGQNRNEWHVDVHDSGYNTTEINNKVNLGFNSASGDVDGYDIDDRAAFKTFEVFTDVRNRPRVLRMEMEERIEKVAKQLNAADINIPQWKFSEILHSAKIKFTDHSILRIVQILGALGNWRRALHVVEWLQSRERFQSYKSRYIYTSVLDVLGKAKRPIEALNIFHAMRQGLSSYPDLAAYHCIATTLGQAGLMKALFDVIDCMRTVPEKKFNLGPLQRWDPRLEPDLVVYNAVLNACVKRKQWEGAFWVLQQLKQQGIKPTNTTYGLVMEVMLACGKYNLVHEFFRKVEKRSIPGVLSYKILLNTLWREGKTDEAVAAVKEMEGRGIVGTASLYYDLARCLCSVGRCQEALLQINKICKVANKPLVVTYTGLLQACLNSGSIENATFIFNQMHKFCSPNIITCNIMLKAYIDHGMFEEAKDLFQKILDGDYQITNRAGLSRKVAPDKFTFNTMIEGCVQTQKWDDFENAYGQMLKQGHHFDARRHLRVVLDACRAGKVQVMELTWKHLFHFQRAPPPPMIKERFCIKLIEDDPAAAMSCIDIHHEIDMRAFSEKSWLNLLNANVDRFRSDTVLRLAHELDALTPQKVELLPVYENLRKACGQLVSDVNIAPTLPHHPEVPCNMHSEH